MEKRESNARNDIKFLEDSFKKYYFEHFDLIRVPNRTSEREFGFQKFNSGMTRHISIKDDKELHLLLMKNIPSDVYCPNACYSFPNLPMNEKDWKEADLIFDIDAKDLHLECRKHHTISKCNECNGVAGDVFIGISSSGKSPNILNALRASRAKGLVTVGMTGRGGGLMADECDHCLRSASDHTPRIQEGHISIGHTLCWLIEQRMFPRAH